MIRFEEQMVIERPIKDVFAFVSDFENMPRWNDFVLKTVKLSDGPVGRGTLYRQVYKTHEQKYQITEYEPNHRVTVRTLPPAPLWQIRLTLEMIPEGTKLIDEWELETDLSGRLEQRAANQIKTEVARHLQKLQRLLEVKHREPQRVKVLAG
jgi:uncharacterized protein YndB with AHSA1/START domain